MRYYKIIHGFDIEQYIEIDETELEKAYYCFLEKKDGVFSGGAIRGQFISLIKPDYHRIMGWNRGYELTPRDYEELSDKNIDNLCRRYQLEAKQKVQYLIDTNQIHLLGKPVQGFEFKPQEKKMLKSGLKSIGEVIKSKENE